MICRDSVLAMSSTVKFSSKMDEKVLEQLRAYAAESERNISAILSEAVGEYLARIRVRPVFIEAASQVIDENEELLERLAK